MLVTIIVLVLLCTAFGVQSFVYCTRAEDERKKRNLMYEELTERLEENAVLRLKLQELKDTLNGMRPYR